MMGRGDQDNTTDVAVTVPRHNEAALLKQMRKVRLDDVRQFMQISNEDSKQRYLPASDTLLYDETNFNHILEAGIRVAGYSDSEQLEGDAAFMWRYGKAFKEPGAMPNFRLFRLTRKQASATEDLVINLGRQLTKNHDWLPKEAWEICESCQLSDIEYCPSCGR